MTELPKAPPVAKIARPSKPIRPWGYVWPVLGVALFIYGITTPGKWWAGSLGFLIILFWLGALSNARKDRMLRAAPHGSVRVETVKQQWVNQRVQQYVRAGWLVDAQSSAKSLGSQARVTLTFRKP